MMDSFATSIKESLGSDVFDGLMGMFLFLHFYYGVPVHGWQKVGLGVVAIFVATLALSFMAHQFGKSFLAVFALITAALALDFFYRGKIGVNVEHLVFEYLQNGPATINFASFGFSSAWFFSQIDAKGKR